MFFFLQSTRSDLHAPVHAYLYECRCPDLFHFLRRDAFFFKNSSVASILWKVHIRRVWKVDGTFLRLSKVISQKHNESDVAKKKQQALFTTHSGVFFLVNLL